MRRKILVVDDDPDQLEVVRWSLKKAGFAIGTAANGVAALVKTRSVLPDLIVLDLMLPELNGFDICKALRKDPVTASIPIIMLTGMRSEFSRLAALESGVNCFLTKPYSPDELVSKVEEMLKRSSTQPKARAKSKMETGDSRSNKRLFQNPPGHGSN
ncbi:MAG: response regulator [Verrucomicrobiota bacterium]|jgi:DNA-binding response OmpR family regulator